MSLPLPSSPHWVPTTTVAGTAAPLDRRRSATAPTVLAGASAATDHAARNVPIGRSAIRAACEDQRARRRAGATTARRRPPAQERQSADTASRERPVSGIRVPVWSARRTTASAAPPGHGRDRRPAGDRPRRPGPSARRPGRGDGPVAGDRRRRPVASSGTVPLAGAVGRRPCAGSCPAVAGVVAALSSAAGGRAWSSSAGPWSSSCSVGAGLGALGGWSPLTATASRSGRRRAPSAVTRTVVPAGSSARAVIASAAV